MPSFIFAEYSDKFFSPGVFLFFLFVWAVGCGGDENGKYDAQDGRNDFFFGMARSLRGLGLASAATEIIFQVGIWEFRMEKLVSLNHYFALPVPLIGAFRFSTIYLLRQAFALIFFCCLSKLWAGAPSATSSAVRKYSHAFCNRKRFILKLSISLLFVNDVEPNRRCNSWE